MCFFGIYWEVISKNDYYMGYFWFSNVFDEFDFFYEMYGIFCVGIFCMVWEIVNSFLKFWECWDRIKRNVNFDVIVECYNFDFSVGVWNVKGI